MTDRYEALIFILVLTAWAPEASAQRTIYVSQQATGAGDGTSWADGFVDLQDGLAVAAAGDEVWVAEGVYRPDHGQALVAEDRRSSFLMPPNVRVYGGFAGGELAVSDRPPSQKTILSGDLLGNDADSLVVADPSRLDNSYTVVEYAELAEPPPESDQTLLEGFVITGGYGDGAVHKEWAGGGLFLGFNSSQTIRNVEVSDNYARRGGGVYASRGAALFVGCVFSGNLVSHRGGAIYADGQIRLDSSLVVQNRAMSSGGGIYFVGSDEPGSITRSTFLRNEATSDGGAATNRFRAPPYINVRFIGNSAGGGGAVSNDDAQVSYVNVEFTGNSATSDRSWGEGGAVSSHTSTVSIINATFSGNTSILPGAAIWNWYSETDVVNSIFWSSNGSPLQEAADMGDPSRLTLSSSIHEGTLHPRVIVAGPILDSAPGFLDPDGPDDTPGSRDDDYRLFSSSPAINAGDNSFIPPDYSDLDGDGNTTEPLPFDLAGNPRIQGNQVDLGAYEAPESTSTGAPPLPLADQSACSLAIFPSPFGDELTVSFQSRTHGTLEVFDMTGRRITRQSVPAGRITVRLDASTWPAGVYLFNIRDADGSCSAGAVRQ